MYSDEGIETKTSMDAMNLRKKFRRRMDSTLEKDKHIAYVVEQITRPHDRAYDMMGPWLSHWIINALFVLHGGERFVKEISTDGIAGQIARMGDDILLAQTTGFGGNEMQAPHLGTTYAALAFLYTVGRICEVRREGVIEFLREMRTGGGFMMHKYGESDARSLYCAIASYALLTPGGVKEEGGLFDGCTDLLLRLQTYEGGFAGNPGEEAHGGYTYCAVAALKILGALDRIKRKEVVRWIQERQDISGGLTGRTNKAVDSCYNYWVGASSKILGCQSIGREDIAQYTLGQCQSSAGGFRDKPDSPVDLYHTSYALVGLYLLGNEDFDHVLGVPILPRPGAPSSAQDSDSDSQSSSAEQDPP